MVRRNRRLGGTLERVRVMFAQRPRKRRLARGVSGWRTSEAIAQDLPRPAVRLLLGVAMFNAALVLGPLRPAPARILKKQNQTPTWGNSSTAVSNCWPRLVEEEWAKSIERAKVHWGGWWRSR